MPKYIECKSAINRIKEYASDVYGIDLDDAKQFSGDSLTENYCEGLYEATELVDDIPAADVAPVVHGRWEQVKKWATKAKYRCSVCGREIMSAVKVNIEKYPYCHCGAKMDGGADDDTDGNV